MDSTTRYLLLILLFIIFLVLSPLIVFYITGRTLPFLDPSPTNTGILDVQTDPDGAKVLLDGEEIGTSPLTIRFVKQGWHEVSISHKDYKSWSKRLFIESGKVTYTGTIQDKVLLLPEQPVNKISDNVSSFSSQSNRVLYAQGDILTFYDLASQKNIRSSSVGTIVNSVSATTQSNYWILTTQDNALTLFNTDNWQLIPLPETLNRADNLVFINNNTIVGLQDNTLHLWAIGEPRSRNILSNARGFVYKDNLFYITTKAGQASQLATYILVNGNLNQELVLLNEGLPSGNVELFITNQKELFLISGESFYRVNQSLELLKNSVLDVSLDTDHQRLTFFTPTEIYFYNFGSGRAELLARTTETLTSAEVFPELGYGFLSSQKGSEAIEIDSRGNQNRYNLFSDSSVDKILISQNKTYLILFANQTLYTLKIK